MTSGGENWEQKEKAPRRAHGSKTCDQSKKIAALATLEALEPGEGNEDESG